MKIKFFALVLCVVSIGMISCNNSDPARDATEQYIKANNQFVIVEISKWNPIPIDTLTKDEFYLYELKKRVKAANDFKRHTLYDDSLEVVRCQQEIMDNSYTTYYFQRKFENAKEEQKRHLAEYQNMVDNINLIKEKQYGSDGNEPIYYVYQFTEKLSFRHPTSKEKISRDFNCYSYVNIIQQTVTYVEEGKDSYSPILEKLASPFKEKEIEEEDELELI